MIEISNSDLKQILCILRNLPKQRGATIGPLSAREQNALRQAALLNRKIQKRRCKEDK